MALKRKPSSATRPHRTVPPLTRGDEAFEGVQILEESPDALGGLLWNSLRNVTCWARTAPASRPGSFADGAAAARDEDLGRSSLPASLEDPLRRIALLLAHPECAVAAELAGACRAIAGWATEEGRFGTALAYLQAAVLLQPSDAGTAYAAGRLARKRAEIARAESWFHYAIVHGRRAGDWASYSLAFIGLGNLFAERGNFPRARSALRRAARTARRHGHRNLTAMALHDLFAIAAETGRVQVAERLAAAAARAYGAGHPRLPYLIQDMAFIWTEHGTFEQALELQEWLRSRIEGFPERLLLVSAIARAAAGAGRYERYRAAWLEAWDTIPDPENREGVAAALLNLAYAAGSAGEWERAGEAAARALQVARQTREGKILLAAEAALQHASNSAKRTAPPHPAAATPRTSASTHRAAERLRALLTPGAQ